MLTLPAALATAIGHDSCSPVILATVTIGGVEHYLSDTIVGTVDGLAHDYLPFVESWGTVSCPMSIDNIAYNGNLAPGSTSLSLIVDNTSVSFITSWINAGVENTPVSLYLWHHGLAASDMALMGRYVCQDPIELSELSMLFKVDLVSEIMANDAYIGSQEARGKGLPYVVGEVAGVELVPDPDNLTMVYLDEDINFDQLGDIRVTGDVMSLMSAGQLRCDSDLFSYDSKTGNTVHVVGRAALNPPQRPHKRGAVMYQGNVPGGFRYNVSCGPLQNLSAIKYDGESPGANPATYTAHFDGEVVYVDFGGEPPYADIKTSHAAPIVKDKETRTLYGGSTYEPYLATVGSYSDQPNINNDQPFSAHVTSVGTTTTHVEYTVTADAGVNCADCPSPLGHGEIVASSNGDVVQCTCHALQGVASTTGPSLLTNLQLVITYGVCNGHDAHFGGSIVWKMHEHEGTLESGPIVDGATGTASWSEQVTTYDIPGSFKNEDLEVFTLYIGIDGETDAVNEAEARNGIASVVVKYDTVSDAGAKETTTCTLGSIYGVDMADQGSFEDAKLELDYTVTTATEDNGEITRSIGLYLDSGTGNRVDDVRIAGVGSLIENDTGTLSGTLPVGTWAQLQDAKCYIDVATEHTENIALNTHIDFVGLRWMITLTPIVAQPDYIEYVTPRKICMTATATTGASPTPPVVAKKLLDDLAPAVQVNTASFAAAGTTYQNNGYVLNGLLDSRLKMRDALKTVLFNGLGALSYKGGAIKFIDAWRFDAASITPTMGVVKAIGLNGYQLRSRKIKNQPVSSLRNSIKCTLAMPSCSDAAPDNTSLNNAGSIAKYGERQVDVQLELVSTLAVANKYCAIYLARFAAPVMVLRLDVFLAAGASIEKGDKVSVPSYFGFDRGVIANIGWEIGQGKTGKINTVNLDLLVPVQDLDPGSGSGSGSGSGDVS